MSTRRRPKTAVLQRPGQPAGHQLLGRAGVGDRGSEGVVQLAQRALAHLQAVLLRDLASLSDEAGDDLLLLSGQGAQLRTVERCSGLAQGHAELEQRLERGSVPSDQPVGERRGGAGSGQPLDRGGQFPVAGGAHPLDLRIACGGELLGRQGVELVGRGDERSVVASGHGARTPRPAGPSSRPAPGRRPAATGRRRATRRSRGPRSRTARWPPSRGRPP